MNPTTHFVKCWPQYFERVLDGSKTFEYRSNDRGYQKGETVVLQEWDPQQDFPKIPGEGKYTGREARFTIGYVLPVNEHFVILSIIGLEQK